MPYTFVYGERRSIINLEANIFTYINNKSIIGNELNNIACYSENNFVEVYYDSKETEKQSKISEKLLSIVYSKKLFKDADNAAGSLNHFLEKINGQDFSEAKNEELLKLFERFFYLLSNVFSYYRFSRPEFTDSLKEKILAEFEPLGLGEKEIACLLTPVIENQILFEKKSFRKLMEKGMSEKSLVVHTKKFPWLFPNTYKQVAAINYLKNRSKKFSVDSKKEVKNRCSIAGKQEEIVSKYGLSEECVNIVAFLRDASILRLDLKCAWSGSEFMALSLLDEISRRINLSTADVMYSYREKEIRDFLEHGIKLPKEDVLSRKKKYFYHLKDGRTMFYSGGYAPIMKEEELTMIPNDNFVVGRIACPGLVNGKVKIVSNEGIENISKELDNFEIGSILVTTMTHPNMVLLLERASGIITDEGGITSHAAILALEMNKPCLVGTKFATKIFKEGDLIELDANKGKASKI
ncbi:MAG: PEP-utilizing enzyme [Candidatus Diapherotrites archaeon]